MLAARVKNRRLVLVQQAMPKVLAGWALVRVRLAGICNTDLEILRGYHNFHGTLGHEFVGEVVRCGGSAAARRRDEGRWRGRRVVGEINLTCRGLAKRPLCDFCKRDLSSHCTRRHVLGIVNHDGAFAEFLTLPLINLHRVPEEVSDELAVFTEPVAAACRILEQVRIPSGARVAVLGDGKLGQLIARVLAAAGAGVTLYGRHREKLALAESHRVATVLLKRGANHTAQRFPYVVDATGSPEGLAAAIQLAEPRGILVLKSTFHGTARMETWPIVVDEMTVVGSRCGPFNRALALLRSGKVDPRRLITRVYHLSEAKAAVREAAAKGVMKILLKP